MTLRLELGESGDSKPCTCCGAASRTVHGFVYRDDDAYAVYYGGWSEGHPGRGVTLAIAVGEWSEGSGPRDRVSIGVLAKPTPSSVDFTVLDSSESPWAETPLLGKMLDRDRARAHPALKEVLHVAEHVVRDDSRVRGFLNRIDVS